MQGMDVPVFDRVLRCRQRLSQDLPAEYLGAADIAAFAAKDVVFDSLQMQERNQVIEDWMHTLRRRRGLHLP